MLEKVGIWVAIVTSILALLGGSGWYQEYNKNKAAEAAVNQRLVSDWLSKIEDLLETNKVIYEELSSSLYSEPGWGILESYLLKIRRDGVPRHALMKQRIDSMDQNNQAIITLLRGYSGYIKTELLKAKSREFINHATLYSDRWGSLVEVYESGADFPTNAPVFPASFPYSIEQEINVVLGKASNNSSSSDAASSAGS